MKKIGLGVLVILFTSASVFANGHVVIKKAKHVSCHSCSKNNCTKKANCPNTANCVCK